MHDMLAAFHFARYLEERRKDDQPCRDVIPDDRFAVGLHLFRKMRREVPGGSDCRK